MSTLSIRLPNSLHEKIRQLAKAEGISINQFIASAAAEKMASLLTESYLKERASRADRKKFKSVLDKVPDVDPEAFDRLDK
ncbi:MAG: YlcI/YnfO family protein [Thermodesulfobacteriota bacterium]